MVSALNHEIIEKSWDVTPLTEIRKEWRKGESSAVFCLSRIRKNCLCGFKIRPLQGFLLFLASQSCIPMYCAIFQGEESTEGAGGKGEKRRVVLYLRKPLNYDIICVHLQNGQYYWEWWSTSCCLRAQRLGCHWRVPLWLWHWGGSELIIQNVNTTKVYHCVLT